MAYAITLEELASRLGAAGDIVARDSEKLLTSLAEMIAERMRVEAPVASGKLRDSIAIVSTPGKRVIGPDVPYADFVELGTQPHVIRAKPGGTLAFSVGGNTVYAAVVNHPGTKPNPFVKRSLDAVLSELAKKYAQAGVEAVVARAS